MKVFEIGKFGVRSFTLGVYKPEKVDGRVGREPKRIWHEPSDYEGTVNYVKQSIPKKVFMAQCRHFPKSKNVSHAILAIKNDISWHKDYGFDWWKAPMHVAPDMVLTIYRLPENVIWLEDQRTEQGLEEFDTEQEMIEILIERGTPEPVIDKLR